MTRVVDAVAHNHSNDLYTYNRINNIVSGVKYKLYRVADEDNQNGKKSKNKKYIPIVYRRNK